MVKLEYDYDKIGDDLFLYRKNCNSTSTIEFGGFNLDMDKKKKCSWIRV